jgi:hypothetical protein
MKRFSPHDLRRPNGAYGPRIFAVLGACVAVGPGSAETLRPSVPEPVEVRAAETVIRSGPGVPRPPFEFNEDDSALLDRVQRAAFGYFWDSAHAGSGLVRDRSSAETVSVAGVGFGLSALTIGVERSWITRAEGEARARSILVALLDHPENRKAGLYYHFLNPDGSPKRVGTELVVSTIDSALLFAGAVTAGQYFGGEIGTLVDRMLSEADWTFFADRSGEPGRPSGCLSLGWKPESDEDPTGDGRLLPYSWLDSGDEHRLSTFMAVCAPDPEHRIDPVVYYRLRRMLGRHDPVGEVVWFPYSGALFTAFFAHCWIDYARLGPDAPSAWGVRQRASVDWWENSRRIVHLHRDRAIENPLGLPTLGENAWGFTACDGPDGYLVPGLFPEPLTMIGAEAGTDYSTFQPRDQWGGGVVAPYGAASSIVFEPALALAAIRHAFGLKDASGEPLAWRDPERGGYGFVDAFRSGAEPWHADDTVAIDHGPMLLMIENARTGLVWDLFRAHPAIRAGFARLRLEHGG